MGYDLPPDERARLRKVENVLIVFFSTIILAAIFGVLYSKFRPLPAVKPTPGSSQPVGSPSSGTSTDRR